MIEKGKINFEFLPEKYSKCPYCGAFLESYKNYRRNKWEETVRFECGLKATSKTPTFYEELGICKNSKKWKNLQKERLKQLEKIKNEIDEKVKDEKLHSELTQKLKSLEYDVREWWWT